MSVKMLRSVLRDWEIKRGGLIYDLRSSLPLCVLDVDLALHYLAMIFSRYYITHHQYPPPAYALLAMAKSSRYRYRSSIIELGIVSRSLSNLNSHPQS